MTIRSRVIGAAEYPGGGGSTMLTVPVGDVSIVKSVNVWNSGAVPSLVRVFMQRPSTGVVGMIYRNTVAAGAADQLQVDVMGAENDQVNADSSASDCHVWVSGVLLQDGV